VVGAKVPASIELEAVPADWGPSISKNRYVYSGDRVMLVDPGTPSRPGNPISSIMMRLGDEPHLNSQRRPSTPIIAKRRILFGNSAHETLGYPDSKEMPNACIVIGYRSS
jgi:hypothetical protein